MDRQRWESSYKSRHPLLGQVQLYDQLSSGRPLALTGNKLRCLNLGSYNYLGFAAADEYCTPHVVQTLQQRGWAACSARSDAGMCRYLRCIRLLAT